MAQFIRVIAAITLFSVAPLARAAEWFGDSHGAHRVDPLTNQIDLDVASAPPVALAIGSDGSVWLLTSSRITHATAEGVPLFSAPVSASDSGVGGGHSLALDATDGSVWIAAQNKLSHLSGSGAALGTIRASADDFGVSADGTLWVLAGRELRRYSSQGALLGTTLLPGAERDDRLLALDQTGGKVWISTERQLAQRDASNPSLVSLSLTLPEEAEGLSVDTQTGALWVMGKTVLRAYSRTGALLVSARLPDLAIHNPAAIAADGGQQAVWLGHERGLTRLSTAGTLIATVPRSVAVRALAVGDSTPVDVQPTLAVVRPQPGALTGARPGLVFQYGATCNGQPCGFPNSAYSSYSLTATLDGVPVGGLFSFNATTGQASYQPAAALADGAHELSGQVTNSAGQSSSVAVTQFTSDGTAPLFLSIEPPSGTLSTASQLVISGMVDDPLATVRLSNGMTASGGSFFNFPVALSAGFNAFTLTATDAAGNSSSVTLSYTYEPPNSAPTVAITSPSQGANFTAPANITLTATASDSDGSVARVDFLRDGTLLGSDTTSPYSFAWSGVATGTYTLTAQAIDNRGAVTLSSPVVISVGPPNALPTVALQSPLSGTSFSAPASVRAVATASDPDGTLAKVDFLRNGVVAATVLAPPYEATLSGIPAGTHTLVARATDDRGGITHSTAATISVVAAALTITSPFPNASLTGDSVLVSGTTAGLPNRGVIVNDTVAAMDASGNFVASVSLVPGGNTLTVVLSGPDGSTLTQSILVSATGEASPFTVTATPAVGMAPLASTFTIANPTENDASFTFDGFGPYGLPAGATSQLTLTYPAGVYAPAIVITDATGLTRTHRVVIDSRDAARLDQLFRAIWSGMNSALVAGDKEGAMRYLNGGAKSKFGPVFDTLMPYMAEIVGSYSPLARSSIGTHISEYAVTRGANGSKRLYLIYFLLDADGIWRIDEM
jgi:hypothetical protein